MLDKLASVRGSPRIEPIRFSDVKTGKEGNTAIGTSPPAQMVLFPR